MILVDTSVWIDHFRSGDQRLSEALRDARVLTHPFVIGELSCGNFKNRKRVLEDLNSLPGAVPAMQREVIDLIESRKLWGLGIGWIDVNLIASALLTHCFLWTKDQQLRMAAHTANVALYAPDTDLTH